MVRHLRRVLFTLRMLVQTGRLDVSSFLSPLFSGGRHETELVCGEAMKSKTLSSITRTFDSVDSISQLDILTVDQWNGTPCLQPEKTLMFAVLLDAVECFQKYAGHEANRLFKDTDEWIFEDDPEWPFSFINICEAVGMDPEYLRKGLSQLNRERSKGRMTVGHTTVNTRAIPPNAFVRADRVRNPRPLAVGLMTGARRRARCF
jgi:hypothetical protein